MRKIIKSAAILSLISVFIKFLGPVKNYIVADQFGVSRRLDAYFISQNLIDIILAIITFSITILVIPLFTEKMGGESEKNNCFATAIDSFLSQTIVVAILISFLLVILSGAIVHVIPGFSTAAARADLAGFLRILSLTIVFTIPFTVIAGYFYSTGSIVLPSLLNSIPLALLIPFVLIFSNTLGLYSLPIGNLLGSATIFTIILAIYIKQRGNFHFLLKNTTIVKRVIKLLVPTMIFSAGGTINLLVDQVIASKIKDGAISILSYSQFMIMIPFFLVTLPLITAIFPEMSRRKASAGEAALAEITGKGVALLFAVLLPIFIVLLFFRLPVIELFYSHGKFDPRLVPEAGRVLLAYGPAMIFLSFNSLIQRFFFIEKKMKRLMLLTVVSIIANLVMDLYFASLLSLAGIAMATSINETLYFLIILWMLRKRLRDIFSLWVRKYLMQGLIAAMAMSIVLHVSTGVFNVSAMASKKDLLIALSLHVSLSLLVYSLILFVFFKDGMIEYFAKKTGKKT